MNPVVFLLTAAIVALLAAPSLSGSRLKRLSTDRAWRVDDHGTVPSEAPPIGYAGESASSAASERSAIGGRAAAGLQSATGEREIRVSPATALGIAAIAMLTLYLAGLIPAALAVAVSVMAERCRRAVLLSRQRDRRSAELASAVAALGEDFLSGVSPQQAFSASARTAEHYRDVFDAAASRAARGEDVGDLFYPRAGRPVDAGLLGVGLASQVALQTGAPMGTALAAVRADLLAERTVRRAVAAALTGPRSSACLLAVLPLVGVGLGLAMGIRTDQILFHTGLGLAMLTAGVTLDAVGVAWTLAMINRAQP